MFLFIYLFCLPISSAQILRFSHLTSYGKYFQYRKSVLSDRLKPKKRWEEKNQVISLIFTQWDNMMKYKTVYTPLFNFLVIVRSKQPLPYKIRTNLKFCPENLSQISLMVRTVWVDLIAARNMREQSPAECLGRTQVMHRPRDGSVQEM